MKLLMRRGTILPEELGDVFHENSGLKIDLSYIGWTKMTNGILHLMGTFFKLLLYWFLAFLCSLWEEWLAVTTVIKGNLAPAKFRQKKIITCALLLVFSVLETDGCGAGQYQTSRGCGPFNLATCYDCHNCDAGNYCNDFYNQYPCPQGTYSGSGAFACTNCLGGSFSSSPGSVFCDSCASGSSSSAGSSSCVGCLAGTYSVPALSLSPTYSQAPSTGLQLHY